MNQKTGFYGFNIIKNPFLYLGLVTILIATSSCLSNKKLRYFDNLSDSEIVRLPVLPRTQAVIMADDVLDIKISGANEATAALLNTYSANPSSTASTSASPVNSGYLVDINGDIEFPIIGKVHAAGLTKEEFKDRLKERVSKYLKDPLVSIRYTNFRFTVLGEVRNPGSFLLNNERVTVLEALGLAGDMTGFGKRKNVRVIRDSSGQREIGILDFTDKTTFTSKYYYLQRNDVIYVETEKYKTQYEDIARISTILATIVSLIAITITLIR